MHACTHARIILSKITKSSTCICGLHSQKKLFEIGLANINPQGATKYMLEARTYEYIYRNYGGGNWIKQKTVTLKNNSLRWKYFIIPNMHIRYVIYFI
jgi:hypothetical protein